MKTDLDIKKFKMILESMREKAEKLSKSTTESRKPVELDQTKFGRVTRMDALQFQAMQLEIERRRTLEIKQIDSALQRINIGDFGYCVNCGNEINFKRLENNPLTPACIECANLSEKNNS